MDSSESTLSRVEQLARNEKLRRTLTLVSCVKSNDDDSCYNERELGAGYEYPDTLE